MLSANLKKHITITTVSSLLVLLSTTQAFALVTNNLKNSMRGNAANSMGIMKSDSALSPSVSGVPNANKMENLKTRASNEIDRRINSLNKLLDRVNALKRLTADQKSGFVTELQSQISSLTSLKAKINADTDMTTLRTDVQSVITSYRIYALFLPQMHLLSTDDILTTVASQFSAFAAKLQTRIDQMKSQGMDTSSLQTLIDDIQKKLADANTQLQNVVTAVVGLTPSGYPGNKTSLQSARSMLVTARVDLETARADALKIMASILAMKAQNGSLSPMPSGATHMSSSSANQ